VADILDKSVHTPVGDAPVIPVALMATGLYLCWFAVHYWGSDTKWPTDPLKAVLTGNPIPVPDRTAEKAALDGIGSAAAQSATIAAAAQSAGGLLGGGVAQAAGVGSVSGQSIAQTALKYEGEGYAWGGPADIPGNWDCSSFVSYVLGLELRHKLPGGGSYGDSGYPPNTHGPTTIDYMMFGTPVSLSQVQPGDLIVSAEHMGIIIDSSTYMSAHSPTTGTHVSGFPANFPGGIPVYRRVV
jgi:cell wall-associated NlpC family hydrolase